MPCQPDQVQSVTAIGAVSSLQLQYIRPDRARRVQEWFVIFLCHPAQLPKNANAKKQRRPIAILLGSGFSPASSPSSHNPPEDPRIPPSKCPPAPAARRFAT